MVSLKRLIGMARKWQIMAGIKRREISPPTDKMRHKVADKGHFVVYTIDKTRFVVPLTCLRNNVFRELLRMSEEHFGLPTDGPIILPCEAPFMEYVLSLELHHALQIVPSFDFGFGSNCLAHVSAPHALTLA
ncbi:unnamed protein product [Sphenostylis stenocarpa]|uniref:Uncharacterized protein n=1 Tax=Sphenostylis stenocarpa TaxID=92480 RepID=A0AA86STT8_9FABA|nr:unnamed protein product [Sphenostylis stenocarpa]